MLGRNTLINLAGLGVPLLVAVFAVPPLIAGLGDARFGLLTLIWAIVSYFGLLDLGLGRALTRAVAAADARGEQERVPGLSAAALIIMAGIGIVGGFALIAAGPLLLATISGDPDPAETARAVIALAVAVPAIVLTAGLRGIMEARGAFIALNLIRLPLGVLTFAGPLAVLVAFGPRLDLIAWLLAGGRYAGLLLHAYFAWTLVREDMTTGAPRAAFGEVGGMLRMGGWITLSSIVSPFMGYIDRFLIGGLIGAAAVAYYSTPTEMITKLWIVPSALTAVLFPHFARLETGAAAGQAGWESLRRGVRWLFLGLLPITLGVALFAHEILEFWINPAFAEESAGVLQLFALGMLVNCLAHVPITLLQAYSRSRAVALLHSAELPLFLAALYFGITYAGIVGAAVAWLVRMAADTILLFVMASRATGTPLARLATPSVLAMAALVAAIFLLGDALPFSVRALLVAAAAVPATVASLGWLATGRAERARLGRAARTR